MDTSVLEKIGLSDAEIDVYLTLLKLGPNPSSRIVRETDFRKSTVYESLGRLQEKGLVSHVTKDSKKYFQASEADRLLEFVEDRKRELEGYEEEIKELIPRIEKSTGKGKPNPEAHVFVGIEGFKTMRRDILKNAKGELLLIGAIGKEYLIAPKFFKNWNRARCIKELNQRVLYKKSYEQEWVKKPWITEELFELRFLPEELESPAVINIYGDIVANVVWSDDYPICFLMVNKELADAYRKYFEYLWALAKRIR